MMVHIHFLREEFASIVGTEQLVVLTYLVTKELPGLRLIPLGVQEDWYRRPRLISDYSFTFMNVKYLPISALSSIQYGQALY